MLALAPSLVLADGPCRAGDTLIGETTRYYYCSRATCQDLGAQLSRDQLALDRLRSSINSSNVELEEWTKQNARAEKDALDHAKYFLVETVLSGITANREAKLEEIEKDIRRADPMGTTIETKLLKIVNFRKSYARLITSIYALKAAEYPGMDIYKTWTDFQERATEIGKETQALAATWDALASDPETQQAFKDHGFEFSADALKQTLSVPLLRQSLDFGQFISDYGYDVARWEKSRELIMQNTALDDKNLYAECMLSRRLRITVRNYNICKGKIPDDRAPRPEDIVCVDHTKQGAQ
jgi:hypothetical protein